MKFKVIVFISLLFPFVVFAENTVDEDITKSLSGLIPNVDIESIEETPIKGLYQVILGPDIIYMSRDGNYVFKGELLDIKNKENLTENVRAGARVKLLKSINEKDYIEFAATDPEDAIYVFTDVDCGYCRKLHREVPELNSRGVSVRYLAYPRAGVNSATGREMSNVWCADNRQKALTDAKNNQHIEAKECDDRVAEQYELGQKLGVRGTPAIFLENGKMLPGYMPPDELIRRLRN